MAQGDLYGRSCPSEVRNRHFFGSLALDPLGPSTYQDFVVRENLLGVNCGAGKDPCLAVVSVDAIEVLRATGVAVNPLPRQAIAHGSGLPAGALRLQNRSQLKVRVDVQRYTEECAFLMDVNQQIEVYGASVSISLVAPADFIQETEPGFATAARTGLVADELIGQSVLRIEESNGHKEVQFTENFFVAAGAREVIEVPPFATRLTAYQSSIGAAETSWEMHYGDPTVGSVEAGTIPFRTGARMSGVDVELPNVTHLRTGIDVNNGRFFTVRWTIRP